MKKWMKYGLLLCLTLVFFAVPTLVADAAKNEIEMTVEARNEEGYIAITATTLPENYEYFVYRAEEENVPYDLIYSTIRESWWYEDYDVEPGQTYYYHVFASNGETEVFSNFESVTLRLRKPGIEKSHDIKTGAPKLLWDDVDADSYQVYRATSKNGQYKKIKTTTECSYIDKSAASGKTYYYKVKGICEDNAKGNSEFSKIISVKKFKGDAKLAAAVDSVVKDGKYKNVLTLADLLKMGKQIGVKNLSGFHGNLKVEGVKITANEMFNIKAIKDAGGSLEFVPGGLGDPYYNVERVGVKKNGAKYMEFDACTYAVNIVKVSKDSTNAEILAEIKAIVEKYYPSSKWKVSVAKYSKSKATGELKELKEIYENYLTKSGYGKYKNNKYILTLQNKSNKNNKVSIYVTAVPTLTRLGKATVTLKNMDASDDVKVSWKKVSKADKYEVWRKVGENGTYKKVKTTTSLSYKDTSTVKGKVYFYKVKAIETSNSTQNSKFSGVKKLTCK